MRIISGKLKGKRLFAPQNSAIRPTTDRIKESLFNILSNRNILSNARVLDLFAGSGALGIEAISCGAATVVFIDKDPESVKLIYKNLVFAGATGYEVFNTDYKVALRKLHGKKFDLIFLDPPYNCGFFDEILDKITEYDILDKNGIIISEYDAQNSLPNNVNRFIIDTRKMGNTCVSILELNHGGG